MRFTKGRNVNLHVIFVVVYKWNSSIEKVQKLSLQWMQRMRFDFFRRRKSIWSEEEMGVIAEACSAQKKTIRD